MSLLSLCLQVVLQFSGVSSRWFPLLQPGSVYRLTAPNTQVKHLDDVTDGWLPLDWFYWSYWFWFWSSSCFIHSGICFLSHLQLIGPLCVQQDPSVLIGCSVAGQKGVGLHADSSLQVRSDWRIHTLTRPLLLPHTWTQVTWFWFWFWTDPAPGEGNCGALNGL